MAFASPKSKRSTHEIVLDLNGEKYGLRLANKGEGGYSFDEKTTEGGFGFPAGRSSKKYGSDPIMTMLEQRTWTDGRGVQDYEGSQGGYFDALSAWTLTKEHLLPTPQWKFATGVRTSENSYMPGDMTFVPVVGDDKYMSIGVAVAAGYTMSHFKMWVRRRGTPGTLTFQLRSNTGGSPTTITLKSSTVTVSTITDVVSQLYDFAPTTPYTCTTATYHMVVYSASTDDENNHWEIGVDAATASSKKSTDGTTWTAATYKMYYRITDADSTLSKMWYFFNYKSNVYACSKSTSGNAIVKKYASGTFTALTSTGLVRVKERPLVINDYVMFPQGSAAMIRKYSGSAWGNDNDRYADFLDEYVDDVDGAQVIKVLNKTTSIEFQQSEPSAFGGETTFSHTLDIGHYRNPCTGTLGIDNAVYIFKEDGPGVVEAKKYKAMKNGMDKTPSARNGISSCYTQKMVYYSWLNSMVRQFGGSSDDVGLSWSGKPLPDGRQGYYSKMEPYIAIIFCAIDAGTSGTSSVQIYDGLTWSEFFRAPAVGMRIRDILVQPVEDGNPRLWIDCGSDIIYIDLPKDVASPHYDSSIVFQHEFVLISPTFDDGAVSLAKYIRAITLATENLNGSTIQIEVDYQTGDEVGTNTWHFAGAATTSPEEVINLHLDNVRRARYRLRGMTSDASVPPVINGIVLDGFTRTLSRKVWGARIQVGGSTILNRPDHKSEDLLAFLDKCTNYPGSVYMTSVFKELHGKRVIISPPSVYRETIKKNTRVWKGQFTLSIMDVT